MDIADDDRKMFVATKLGTKYRYFSMGCDPERNPGSCRNTKALGSSRHIAVDVQLLDQYDVMFVTNSLEFVSIPRRQSRQ